MWILHSVVIVTIIALMAYLWIEWYSEDILFLQLHAEQDNATYTASALWDKRRRKHLWQDVLFLPDEGCMTRVYEEDVPSCYCNETSRFVQEQPLSFADDDRPITEINTIRFPVMAQTTLRSKGPACTDVLEGYFYGKDNDGIRRTIPAFIRPQGDSTYAVYGYIPAAGIYELWVRHAEIAHACMVKATGQDHKAFVIH